MTHREARDDRARDGKGSVRHRSFCGYCGEAADDVIRARTRVCDRCEMGLLLSAGDDSVPRPDEPFVVVDELMAVRAVSRNAEDLLGAAETALVGRHVGDLLVPAELMRTEPTLPRLIAQAMRSEEFGASAILRPRGDFGVRFAVRVVGCRPGPAALIVVTERL